MDIRNFFGVGRKNASDSTAGMIKKEAIGKNILPFLSICSKLLFSPELSSATKKSTAPQSSSKAVLSRSLVIQDDSEEEEHEETKENLAEGDSAANIVTSTMIVKDSESSSTVVKNKDKGKGTKKAPKVQRGSEKREEKTDSEGTVHISLSALKRISWAAGDPVPYMALVDAFDDISKVSTCMHRLIENF